MEKILPISLVIIIAILAVIFWHKKINPESSWIYAIYTLTILTIYVFVAIIL